MCRASIVKLSINTAAPTDYPDSPAKVNQRSTVISRLKKKEKKRSMKLFGDKSPLVILMAILLTLFGIMDTSTCARPQVSQGTNDIRGPCPWGTRPDSNGRCRQILTHHQRG